jgi:hypothetical protein
MGETYMQAKEIRECGVYALPGGREVIAIKSRYGTFKFYDAQAWKYYGPPVYEVDERGMITSFGRPTPWRVEDLMDVGQTVAPQGH